MRGLLKCLSNHYNEGKEDQRYLYATKWPQGFACARCGGRKSYFIVERGREQCADCKKQTSVTAGTLFHGQRAGLRKWFRAILEFTVRKYGCNAQDIRRLVGVSEPIAWQWLHKFRETFGKRERRQLKFDAGTRTLTVTLTVRDVA